MTDLSNLTAELNSRGESGSHGFHWSAQKVPGDVVVIRVEVEQREELPIFVSGTTEEILCVSYLFAEDEIRPEMIPEMHSAMLTMSIPMRLSAFGKIGQQYVVFGSLAGSASADDIANEIITLSDNTLEAIEAMRVYLK